MDSKSQDSSVLKQKSSAFRTDPDCPTWGEKIEVLTMKTLFTLTHLKRTAPSEVVSQLSLRPVITCIFKAEIFAFISEYFCVTSATQKL